MLLLVRIPFIPFGYFTEASAIDIKALTIETPALISQLGPAFEKYNEEQFATVKLPGSSQHVSLMDLRSMGLS